MGVVSQRVSVTCQNTVPTPQHVQQQQHANDTRATAEDEFRPQPPLGVTQTMAQVCKAQVCKLLSVMSVLSKMQLCWQPIKTA